MSRTTRIKLAIVAVVMTACFLAGSHTPARADTNPAAHPQQVVHPDTQQTKPTEPADKLDWKLRENLLAFRGPSPIIPVPHGCGGAGGPTCGAGRCCQCDQGGGGNCSCGSCTRPTEH
jgi:hypothetical protein